MDLIGSIHLAFAVLAMVSGLGVVLARKGTPQHRFVGRIYATGLIPVWLRRPAGGGWRELHARFMSWACVGLLAAAVSEIATRYLEFPFGATVAIASAFVILTGGVIIGRQIPITLNAPPVRGLRDP